MTGMLLIALLAAGCSDEADGGCADDPTGPGCVAPLAAPANVVTARQGADGVRVTWDAVPAAATYVVERASSANPGIFAEVAAGLTATQFDDAGLVPTATYSYRVAARNASATSSFSSAVTFSIAGPKEATLTAVPLSRTLYADTLYKLSGFVKVSNGATLTIQPGTRIVGDPAVAGSSLWILRGAKIDAQGTAAAPIVFTSSKAPGSRKPGDWGGIIIIGNGIINRSGTVLTEGPAGVAENYGGGNNNADNSGTLRYVRIEFAGLDVSGGGNSELNGLSMYGVGSGTTIEYVQTVAGLDDSFEWWGGAVDGRYLVSYEAGDDHFDTTEGYVGRNQFLIGYQSTRLAPAPGTGLLATDPQGFEMDGCSGSGCTTGEASTPLSDPVFANFTLVGMGAAETQASGGNGAVIRRGTRVVLHNGIIAGWKGTALNVRDVSTNTANGFLVQNIVLAANGKHYDDATANPSGPFGQADKFLASNHIVAPGSAASLFTSLATASLDWTPAMGSPAAAGGGTVPLPAGRTANFFGGTLSSTAYIGAADPAGAKWWAGWTVHVTD